jgi:hypothetical protein
MGPGHETYQNLQPPAEKDGSGQPCCAPTQPGALRPGSNPARNQLRKESPSFIGQEHRMRLATAFSGRVPFDPVIAKLEDCLPRSLTRASLLQTLLGVCQTAIVSVSSGHPDDKTLGKG